MIKRVAAALAVATLLALVSANPSLAAGERSLSLSASKFSFSAAPGQKGIGEVIVINDGTTPVAVRVYVADQIIGPDGTATFTVPDNTTNRLAKSASWLTFTLPPDAKAVGNIPYVDLPVGARLPVAFEVVVPDGAPPGDRQAVLFFEIFSPEQAAASGTARINARLGARIKTRVNGEIVEKVDVRPFTMPRFVIGPNPEYSFLINNDGNIDQDVSARLLVLDGSEAEVSASAVLTDTPVYAASALEKHGVLTLPGLGLGPHHVRLVVTYKGDSGVQKSVEKDRTVWAAPVWFLVAVATVIMMLLAAWIWFAASRATENKMRSDREQAGSIDEECGDE